MNNKSEDAYQKLVTMITLCELEPGVMVSEGTLMELSGMGRTPVRDALQRLAIEKLVEIHPRRGILIPSLSVEVQLKLLEVRRHLEVLVVQLAAHRASFEQKKQILNLLDEELDISDREAFNSWLSRVHHIVLDSANNEYLTVAMLPLQGLSRRFWFAHMKDVEQTQREARQYHSNILKAICNSDQSEAEKCSIALNDYLSDFSYQTLRK